MTATVDNELFSWLKLFWTSDDILSYDLLSDGYFLNEVFKEIDPNSVTNEQLVKCRSIVDCIKNWEILLKNIRVYYMLVLQQAFVIRLPSIITICYDPHSYKTHREIDKTIFLILGAAVQCERKEYFIQDIITRLPEESIQHGLMGYIKQITESHDTVINCIHLEEFSTGQMVKQLRCVTEQWEDSFIEDTKAILSQNDALQNQIQDQKNQIQVLKNVGVDNGIVSYSSNSDKTMALELAECKAKLRKLQNELDDKNDIISDLRDDLEMQQSENTKLKESQMKLTNESRRLRMLQDELDSQRELILRMPSIEADNQKLKEKVNELEYYRVRCEELREDLVVIANENSNLVDKIENNKKVVERAATLEVEYRKATRKNEELEQSISSHLAEITKLEYKLMSMQEKDNVYISSKSELENELKRLQESKSDSLQSSSISDQVIEKTNAKLLRLEIENRSLLEKLSDIKFDDTSELNKLKERISELEEENDRLHNKVSRLQQSNKKEIQQYMEIEESKQLLFREKQQLDMEIKSVQENTSRRIQELVQENENLSETIMIIRERSEKSNDLRVSELEKENSKLHLSMNELNHKLSKMEFDMQRMNQKCNKLDSSLDKSYQDNLQLSKKNAELEKELVNLKMFKSRLEELQDKFSILEVEKLQLDALVSEYYQQLQQSTSISNETLEENMKELAMENQRKTSQLMKKISELESELVKTKTENEKCFRQINKSENKIKSLEQELESSKTELAGYSRIESKLKLAERNLSEMENEREELQTQSLKLEQNIKQLDKENHRFKNQYDAQLSSVNMYQNKINEMETKIHLLELDKFDKKEFEDLQLTANENEKRLVDSERKNRELIQQIKEEKRQCSTLREELLNERIVSQNLKNQIQNLSDELERIGIIEFEANEEKFKILESKVNSTVEDTVHKKEEQITSLQSRLGSSIERNKELIMKLEEQEARYNSLEQKYEEELAVISVKNNRSSKSNNVPSFTQHLLDLKDDLIKVERKNAQLDSEKQHLNSQCEDLKDKMSAAENKYIHQLDSLQKKHSELNNTNMKLEIQISTLKSQLDTLRTANVNLSNQITNIEKNLLSSVDDVNSLTKFKQQLEAQCSSLQKLNNQLSTEYEILKKETKSQKSINKSINAQLSSTNDELLQYKKEAESLKHLKEILESEKNNLADGARQLISLREENNNLSQEKNDILQSKYKIEAELKSLNQNNKYLKCELNNEKEITNQLKEKISNLEAVISKYEKDIVKLEAKIEALNRQNEYLIEENKKLLIQMKSMLLQNQDLITETLQTRQNQFSEEVALRDKLSKLQRHKERLEEKIMEQFKSMPSTKKTNLSILYDEPKGGRNKFLKKAKEILRRNDSKSSVEQEGKNKNENPSRMQRSRSCGTILGSIESIKNSSIGDKSTDYQIDHTDTSEKEDFLTDNEGSEMDCGAPTPKLKSSRLSNSDTYSMISSISQQESFVSNSTKLIPGSMSIYDRDENEKSQNKEIYNYLQELNDKKIKEDKSQTLNKAPDIQKPVMRQEVNVKTLRNHSRPQTSLDLPINGRRPGVHGASVSVYGSSNGNVDSLIFGNITSKNTSNQFCHDNSSVSSNETSIVVAPVKKSFLSTQPIVPQRKQSLPVTDRFEEELTHPEIAHDIMFNRSSENSKRTTNPVIISRPQSTTPGSASSKTILQRMTRNQSKVLAATGESKSRGRPQTPTGEIRRLSVTNPNNNNYNHVDISPNNNLMNFKPRPQTSLGSANVPSSSRRPPPVSQRTESNKMSRNSSDIDDFVDKGPIPPMRKESDKLKSNYDSGSNASDKSEKNKIPQKLYFAYGNV